MESIRKENYELNFGTENCEAGGTRFKIFLKDDNYLSDEDKINNTFPELAHLYRWRGCDIEHGPLISASNALGFAMCAAGLITDRFSYFYNHPNPIEEFKLHVLFVDGEELPNLNLEDGEDEDLYLNRIVNWLNERRAFLKEEMIKDLKNANII